ncbi:MAG: MgtC/SapB family protein [Oscillospiraceae bacterium]|nr:MgtC/SapB family protein [Oscillospiraceae bacterium]
MYQDIITFFRDFNTVSIIVRMLVATLMGGVIGMERGRHGRAAGLRTHVLVCLGAAITAIVGLYTTETLGYSSDPLRVGAQVMSGIGFLGVGSILIVGKSQIRGLTTAAGLWVTAAIGLAAGIGYIEITLAGTLIVFFTMTFLTKLEASSRFESNFEHYYIELSSVDRAAALIEELRDRTGATETEITRARSGIAGHIGLEVIAPLAAKGHSMEAEIADLQSRDFVVVAVKSY